MNHPSGIHLHDWRPAIPEPVHVTVIPRHRWLYSARLPGFLRMSFHVNDLSIRLVFIDTRKHRAIYSDRMNGWRFGPFILRLSIQ